MRTIEKKSSLRTAAASLPVACGSFLLALAILSFPAAAAEECFTACQEEFVAAKQQCQERASDRQQLAVDEGQSCRDGADTAEEREACQTAFTGAVREIQRGRQECGGEASRDLASCRASCEESPSDP